MSNNESDDDDASSLGWADLTQQLLQIGDDDDDDDDDDDTTRSSSASATSSTICRYGLSAAGAADYSCIGGAFSQQDQTASHLLKSPNITLRGDNHSNSSSLSIEAADIICHRLRYDATLQSLRIDECSSSCPVTRLVMQAVGYSLTLQEVHFYGCSSLLEQVEVREALQRNTSLRELSMHFMGGEEFSSMLEIMLASRQQPNFTSLVLFECEMDPDWEQRLARGLHQNTSLAVLRIVSPTIRFGVTKSTTTSTSNSTTSLQATTPTTSIMSEEYYGQEEEQRQEASTMALLKSICQLPLLRILVLAGFDFGETVQASLGSLLSRLHVLEQLSLPRNGIDAIGCASLASFLQHNTRLQQLDLSRNRCIGDEDGMALSLLLPCGNTAATLQELELNYVGLTDHGMQTLAAALPSMSSLKTLSLIDSTPTYQHTRQGIRHLIKGLSNNYSLTSLSIWPDNDHLTLQFYLRANRAGRGNLLQRSMDLPTALWPVILERTQRYGSDVLFCFLRESQSLFL